MFHFLSQNDRSTLQLIAIHPLAARISDRILRAIMHAYSYYYLSTSLTNRMFFDYSYFILYYYYFKYIYKKKRLNLKMFSYNVNSQRSTIHISPKPLVVGRA